MATILATDSPQDCLCRHLSLPQGILSARTGDTSCAPLGNTLSGGEGGGREEEEGGREEEEGGRERIMTLIHSSHPSNVKDASFSEGGNPLYPSQVPFVHVQCQIKVTLLPIEVL